MGHQRSYASNRLGRAGSASLVPRLLFWPRSARPDISFGLSAKLDSFGSTLAFGMSRYRRCMMCPDRHCHSCWKYTDPGTIGNIGLGPSWLKAVLSPSAASPVHDSADGPICGRLWPHRREYEREITVGEQERRAAPTRVLAGRDGARLTVCCPADGEQLCRSNPSGAVARSTRN
jgi:hypothetical protein